MKSSKNLIGQLKIFPYFTKNTIRQLGERMGLKPISVDTYISRFLKSKEIVQLKNGLYVTVDFYNKNRSDVSYSYYLANILRKPSYISLWTALQYYNLCTESIYPLISVTPKVMRTYDTKAGVFNYRSIKKELFSKFVLIGGTPTSPNGKFDFYIASPPKAVFDLLYFKTHQFRGIRLSHLDPLLEDLRIDVDEMNKRDRDDLYSIVKKYMPHE